MQDVYEYRLNYDIGWAVSTLSGMLQVGVPDGSQVIPQYLGWSIWPPHAQTFPPQIIGVVTHSACKWGGLG